MIRKDRPCAPSSRCTLEHDSRLGIPHLCRMFQDMDRHICYESNSSREGNHHSKRIPVDTRCTDHRCNPADRRTKWLDRCVGISRSFRMDVLDTDAVTVRLLLVRLKFRQQTRL